MIRECGGCRSFEFCQRRASERLTERASERLTERATDHIPLCASHQGRGEEHTTSLSAVAADTHAWAHRGHDRGGRLPSDLPLAKNEQSLGGGGRWSAISRVGDHVYIFLELTTCLNSGSLHFLERASFPFAPRSNSEKKRVSLWWEYGRNYARQIRRASSVQTRSYATLDVHPRARARSSLCNSNNNSIGVRTSTQKNAMHVFV